MQIKHVKITNYRGVRQLDWSIHTPLSCLIGPGDSTKSTILDAIEKTLSPYWNITFEDCDFYQADTSNPIEIIITITQLPDELLTDQKFGLYQQGWSTTNGIHDEPQENDDPALSIRLHVDESLEPTWTVVNNRDIEGRNISSRDREKLHVNRLGTYVDKHLSWRRGSSLLHLTSSSESANSIVTEANRKAREAAKLNDVDDLKSTAQLAKKEAAKLGVKPESDFLPALDTGAVNIGVGAISLHDGNIPVRLTGLGSKRLIALAVQLSHVKNGSVLLIDEVEHGLEPHRIRRLLQHFQELASPDDPSIGQVLMTSHSHTAILELSSEFLYTVQSASGVTNVKQVGSSLQSITRSVPEAFLGRKVIICEGKTEYGFCRSLERYWGSNYGRQPLAYMGAVLVEGGGDSAPQRAFDMAKLGYETCLILDSDKLSEVSPDIQTLITSGVTVIYWDGDVAIEERIALDLPWSALKELLVIAVEIKNDAGVDGTQCIFDRVCGLLNKQRTHIETNLDHWLEIDLTEDQIRKAIGKAAKEQKKGWFKRIDHGEKVGDLVAKHLATMAETDLAIKLQQLNEWIYG